MNFLQGWKTYIVAAGAILTALGAYLNGSIDLTQLITAIFAAVSAMTIRAAVAKGPSVKLVVAPLLVASMFAFTSCANFGQNAQQVLGPLSQVQADITYLGGRAKQYISADNQAKLHNFAVQLNTTANADLSAVYALLPSSTGSVTGDLLVNTLKMTLQLIVTNWSHNNQTLLSYFHAVGNGLLANF